MQKKYTSVVDLLSETSMKKFPRAENSFKKYQSLDFQEYRSLVFETHDKMQKRKSPMKTEIILWFIFSVIGVLVGSIAFALSITEDFLTEVKIWVAQHFMQLGHTDGAIYTAFGFYVIYSIIIASIAGALTDLKNCNL